MDAISGASVRRIGIVELAMQTTVLRLTNLPTWDVQVVTALHQVASLHPSQDTAVAIAITDHAGQVYRTATINGVQQLAQLERELHALGLVAPYQNPGVDVVTFVPVRSTQPG